MTPDIIKEWLRRKYVVRPNRGIDYLEAGVDDLANELSRFIAAWNYGQRETNQ